MFGGRYEVDGADPHDPLERHLSVNEAWEVAVKTPGASVVEWMESGREEIGHHLHVVFSHSRVVAKVAMLR